MNKKYKIVLMLLIVILTISSYFFIKEMAENKKENEVYDELQEIIQDSEKSTDDNSNMNNEITTISDKTENKQSNYNLDNILKINSDVIGWIKINGTNIDYPIMQNGDYYLHRNIYKKYSSHGTPYLANHCNLKTSNNLIIYGHHMNDNSMFSQLDNYKKYSFYQNHKYIQLYTLENGKTIENTYQIVIAFKTVAYSDKGFKYYNYSNFYDEQEFKFFIDNCRKLQFYNTGESISYNDKLITLSTCEYSQKNGRMVIVAKKI